MEHDLPTVPLLRRHGGPAATAALTSLVDGPPPRRLTRQQAVLATLAGAFLAASGRARPARADSVRTHSRTKLVVLTAQNTTAEIEVDVAVQAVIGIADTATAGPAAPAPPAAPPPGPPLVPGGNTVGGTIDAAQPEHQFTFAGQRGQRLELWARRAAGITLVPGVRLVDPYGATEAKAYDSSGGAVAWIDRTLQSTGTYTVVLRGVWDTTGPFSLTWALDRIGSIAPGKPVQATIVEPDRQADHYRFVAAQGTRLTAWATRTAGITLVPHLQLVDPYGATEAKANGSSGGSLARIERVLASSGVYTLVVRGVWGTTGPYSAAITFSG